MTPYLAACAARLESLVAGQRFEEALPALEEYGRAVVQALAGLRPGDPRAAELAAEWRRRMEATRRRALAARSHAAARLARLPSLGGFSAPAPRRTWEIFG